MNKEAKIAMLLDVYGGALSKVQFDSMDLYYNQDLSLSEISCHTGRSRQGVRDAIKRAELALNSLESSLGFLKRIEMIRKYTGIIKDIVSKMENSTECLSGDLQINDSLADLKVVIDKLNSI